VYQSWFRETRYWVNDLGAGYTNACPTISIMVFALSEFVRFAWIPVGICGLFILNFIH